MDIIHLIIVPLLLSVVIIFFPDFFPVCACCRKLKFRPLFKIHKVVGIKLGYSACKSVCRKCCNKYHISSIQELERVKSIKRKVETSLSQEPSLDMKPYKLAVRKKL